MKPCCWICLAILNLSFFIFSPRVSAQKIGIAYYDLDHLYDTIPALFYNDTDYTPVGKLRWNTARYKRKIRNTAAVIDSLGLPLVALWGAENEEVVRDIAAACEGEYCYLHRTLNSFDGLDLALLYFGDVFFPTATDAGRRYLYIEGVLRRDTIALVLCSDTHTAQWLLKDLRADHPTVKLVVAGRTSSIDLAAVGLRDPLAQAARAGRGNIRQRSGWIMRDRILVDTALCTAGADVYARRYLMDSANGSPLPTYDRRQYRGGYGYALPIYTFIK
ncbi:MAG: hypothetical protein RRY33_01725 [Alistipes sp.]